MKTNKPYFAKYLPVEGEIKEGDKVLVSRPMGAFIGTVVSNKIVSDNNVLMYSLNEVEKAKVKLFLCSRDVKMGDKVKIEGGSFNDYEIDREEQIFNGHLFYKIIGEISPEATWIKEGDEFDITDVKRIAIGIGNPVGSEYHIYEILGPCGHFH